VYKLNSLDIIYINSKALFSISAFTKGVNWKVLFFEERAGGTGD
jgi:hypothetical protein